VKKGERSLLKNCNYLPINFASRIPGPNAMYEYDLFAVINHEGQMDNGHYTNFARFQDEVSQCSEVLLHAC
jgi:ubiquitin C-terminal hydrolase